MTTPHLPAARRVARRRATISPLAHPQVLGPWELCERLGGGTYSEVFSARPLGGSVDSADYAIKRVKPTFATDDVALRLLRNEATCGQQVTHQHLVPILAADLDQPPFYLVMPRIAGATLRQVLSASTNCSVPQALWLVRQLVEACCTLHASGWIHGDIKPANVIAHANGHATLIDYGFALQLDQEYPRPVCTLQSTLAYTAPELFTSHRGAGPASDVYSLGVMLFELLTGRLPFLNQGASRLAEAHLYSPAPSARSFAPAVPRDVCQCVSRMLAKEPYRRPSTSGELQDDLASLETETFAMRLFFAA